MQTATVVRLVITLLAIGTALFGASALPSRSRQTHTTVMETRSAPATPAQTEEFCTANPGAPGCLRWSKLRSNIKGGKAVAVSLDGQHVFVSAPGVDVGYKPADGTQQWSATNTILDQADLVLSLDGARLVATGESQYVHPTSPFPGREMKTTAYNTETGAILWQAEYRGADFNPHHANAIAVGGPRIFVTGGRNVPYKMVTVAYDVVTGQQLWVSEYDAANQGADRAYVDDAIDVGATRDGSRVFITGLSQRPDGIWYDWATVAYDGQTGQELWVKRLASDGDAHAEPKQLRVSPSGKFVYVAGYADVLIDGPIEGFSNDFVVVAYDASTGSQVWRSDFRPPPAASDDIAWSIDVSPDGQAVYVAGYTEDPTANGGLNGYRILRLNALTGTQIWVGNVPLLSPTQDDRGLFGHADVRVSADSSEVYLALSAQDNSQFDPLALQAKIIYATLAYRARDGVLLWRNIYDSTSTEDEYAQRLAPSPAGDAVFVTGLARNGPGDQRLLTIAIAAGAGPASPVSNPDCLPDPICPEWTTRDDGPDHLYDRGLGIVTSPDSTRVYTTGASATTTTGLDVVTKAYTADTGQQLWEARYNGPSNGDDAPYGFGTGAVMAISPDGATIFVTGRSAVNGKNEYLTIAYHAADGTEAWSSHYSTPQESQATSLALSGDGQRLYVTGYSALGPAVPPAPPADNYDFATVAYDTTTGQQLWVARYEGPAAFWDVPYSICVANVQQPNGSQREQVFVTGRSNGASSANNHADFATVAYDGQDGTQLWVSRYDGPAHDRDLAYAVSASPNGSCIFITGESVGNGTSSDYATVSYESVTGAERWVARYEQDDLDLGLGLAVNPTGNRVAITGFSVNPGAITVVDRSVATIVYDTSTGAQVWAARHSEVDGAAAARVAFSRDGRRLYIAGLENGNVIAVGAGAVGGQVGHAPALTIAYDATNGSEAWAVHYTGPFGDEGNSALAISPDGAHVFVTGGGQSQGADFATLSYPGLPPLPEVQLIGVTSRKIHGSADAFEIALPISGNPGIECRSGGESGNYTLVFRFANPLTRVDGASVVSGTGSVFSRAIDSTDAHKYIVDLTGVTNAQAITVSLTNVSDSAGNFSSSVSISMGVLLGDVNGNRVVSNTDVASVKGQVAAPVTASNFRNDVNANGLISNTDVSTSKAQVGTSLP